MTKFFLLFRAARGPKHYSLIKFSVVYMYSVLQQALGNHEFDLTPDGLAPYLKDVDFDVISCNIDASKEPVIDGLFEKSVVKTVGGEQIGVVGYTHSRTNEISQSRELFVIFIKPRLTCFSLNARKRF